MHPFLSLSNISKRFGGVQALDNVSLTVYPGEIHCLVGENGSGKSTLIKIIAGVVEPDSGTIAIDGKVVHHWRPIEAIRAGIEVIYQDFSLFPNLSVAENIALSHELSQGKRWVNWREVRAIATETMRKINVQLDLDAPVGEIPVADKQLVAICRALVKNARLIIMDEATTALTEKEIRALFDVIHNVKREGVAVLFVSHKLDEVLAIADKALIIRNGKVVLDADARELDRSKLTYYMTGRDIAEESFEWHGDPNAPPLLAVRHLTAQGSFYDVSFDLRAGEILGITGLLGSGRTELALALFGVLPADSGEIILDGKPIQIRSIQDALAHGIGYVPEDRLTEGLFLERSIANNVVARVLDELRNGLLLDGARLKQVVQDWVQRLSIKTPDPELPAKSLSGGNQQRVVLAKWLASKPRVLILNGPTVGVDVGSKSELHAIIKQLARSGLGIIIISDDIPELMQTCNRILLMKRGRVVEHFERKDITEQDLTHHLVAV